MKTTIHFLAFVLAIFTSHLFNLYFIDNLLDIFKIMSSFSLIANRVALTLFLYYLIDILFLTKNYQKQNIVNKLFIIYIIWLIGLLYGRFTRIENYNYKCQYINVHF